MATQMRLLVTGGQWGAEGRGRREGGGEGTLSCTQTLYRPRLNTHVVLWLYHGRKTCSRSILGRREHLTLAGRVGRGVLLLHRDVL